MSERTDAATVQLKVRMKEPLRAAIETQAAVRGISMNAEIVDRLEKSFEGQRYLEAAADLAYGSEVAAILSIIGRVMRDTGPHAALAATGFVGGSMEWVNNPFAFDQVAQAVAEVFDRLRPAGKIEEPKMPQIPGGADLSATVRSMGKGKAQAIISAIKSPEDALTAELRDFARQMEGKMASILASRRRKDEI